MHTIEEHVDIRIPAKDAYAQWTQFEAMPTFLSHVRKVDQVDDTHVRWHLRDAGESLETEITEQIPDKRIAWTSIGGAVKNSGCVTFHRLDEDHCRVMLQLGLDVDSGAIAPIQRGVVEELGNFRKFLESRGDPTGRWNGEVPSPDERAEGS